MDAEKREASIDMVARHAVARCIDHAVATNRIDWGDYPDLVEGDWDAVLERAQKIADETKPTLAAYEVAYKGLAGRWPT